ncbi:lipase [Alcanivorax sp. 97CO-5]|jgi:acetyl esterase/lipase|uniref:alpha/beta hydrolase n=1 Tax=unclassified Alcanivorax TaxID=2638842 RepID=UPI0003E7FFE2|nr:MULTISPECIES: alpha/beta hydrolase [unclassified Alcanivorax]EUC68956.1 lipase [Alcanivorax sp. 97CO-5]PKG01065.1 alpha/beta hydrolase [Alcanivorax sp. 97CO-6]
MASIPAHLMKLLLRAGVKRDIRDPDKLVKHLRRAMNAPLAPSPLPRGIRLQRGKVAGTAGHWLSPTDPQTTILYLHGGAFIGGRLATYHNFCGHLARTLNARVFLPDYRLAPEHPFPAATDDAFNVYRELMADPRPIVIAGDSAGGNLTLVTLLRARDHKLRMPACAVAISPASDARGNLMSRQANSDSDAMLSHCMIEVATDVYLAGADPAHPYASPITQDFTGLPPLLFTVSSEECLRDDAYAAAHCARQAGVPVQLLERKDMPHVWPVFTFLLPEAKQDLPTIVRFLRKYLASTAPYEEAFHTANEGDTTIPEISS